MLRRQGLRWRTIGAVTMLLFGAGTAAVIGPADAASAQPDEECTERRLVIVGENANGDPIYGYEYVNICETPGSGSGSGGPVTCEHSELGEFPCYDAVHGWWSSSVDCYASPLSPQPPAGDPMWQGNDPSDGVVYQLQCPQPDGSFASRTDFLDEAPEGPSVAELAERAVENLVLPNPDVGIAPSPDGVGLVGLPVWMWISGESAEEVSTSVSGPGITVTARGRATEIEWDMGDGTVKVCDGPGTPYEPHYEGQPSPDCGHIYTEPSRPQPDGRYQITVTTTWHVEWWVEQDSGLTGDELFTRGSSTSVQINELQVVTS